MLVYVKHPYHRCFVDFLAGKFSSTIILNVNCYSVVVDGINFLFKHHIKLIVYV